MSTRVSSSRSPCSRRFWRAAAGVVLASTALPALAAEGGGASLITPVIGTIFWTIVTFILLALLLARFAWKPLVGALDERQRSIEGSLEQAHKEREDAGKLLEEHRALVAQARRERAEALAVGQKEGEQLRAEILEQGRQEREQLLQQTEQQVQAGIKQAQVELRNATADLAIQVAEKLLTRNLDDEAQRKLVEQYLADLERESATPPTSVSS